MSEGNYSMVGLRERVEEALAYHGAFVSEMLAKYEARSVRRRELGIPCLAVLGMGRAGKDTASEYLGVTTQLFYGGSSSTNLCVFVSYAAGVSQEKAWTERHSHREFWIAVGHAVRGHDLTLLCRMVLGLGDMAVGLRGRQELHGCLRDGVIDAAIWIDNPRVENDITVEFTAADCDLMVPNHGSYSELYRKLDKLAELLHLPVRKLEK